MSDQAISDRRAARGGLLALVHAAVFAGLLLAGMALLTVLIAPLVIAGLGGGHLIMDLQRGATAHDARRGTYLAALLGGLAGCWLVPPVALPAARRLAIGTRSLARAGAACRSARNTPRRRRVRSATAAS